MRFWVRFLFGLLGLGVFNAAHAAPPESGGYWNASQSGRGYQIEIQGSTLWVYAYAFSTDGSPVFYLSAGQMTNSTSFTGKVYKYSGGQCFGCPYNGRPVESPELGTVSIEFTSPVTANMTFLGEPFPITRFDATGYLSKAPDVMLGEWAVMSGSTAYGYYNGDRLTFTSVTTDGSGQRIAVGNITGRPAATAAATWDPSQQKIFIVVKSSASYYDAWVFQYPGYLKLDGVYDFYAAGSGPSNWEPAIGTRLNYVGGPQFGASSAAVPAKRALATAEPTAGLESKLARKLERAATAAGTERVSLDEARQLRVLEAFLETAGADAGSAK